MKCRCNRALIDFDLVKLCAGCELLPVDCECEGIEP